MEHLKQAICREHLLWALGGICQLHRIPFSSELVANQFAPPYSLETWLQAAASLKFKATDREVSAGELHALVLPCVAVLRPQQTSPQSASESASASPAPSQPADEACDPAVAVVDPEEASLALVLKADNERVLCFEPGNDNAKVWSIEEFAQRFSGHVLLATPEQPAPDDAGSVEAPKKFGFRWFLPELLKHKKVWREVLLASLVIQLMALATPLFTQVIIDKVIAHHSTNTLVVIGLALVVFMSFTAALSWVRQYLILHTGNRVDAVLATQVFEHLFRLPPRYFDFRPTGTLISRVQGVETIREFLTGAAVTLLLDFPFLLIFLAVMFYYSWLLSLVALGLLLLIAGLSFAITPVLRARLNKQFMLGARNQAFLTEYVSGMETVKSLQMEPQLGGRYGDYMASYVEASFNARQLSNTYNVVASTLEQLMTLSILCVGAWMAMTRPDFTIGMLVAFQMFASRLSGPMLRMVGLWQQLQQTNIAVERLGDIMNAPSEPYSLTPSRDSRAHGKVEIQRVGFRYGENLPFLYRDLSLTLQRGKCVALMGPSGSGKSTLAKLLQGFYLPEEGRILLDGRDIRHLGANELRRHFGVVPQETVLFSGTIYDNLVLANPHATFEQVVEACRLAEIHEVIEQLPEGYQSKVGEHGAGLSGGQKQRIAIARALLKRPKILVFDEATSGLDQLTAEHFAQTINRLKGKVTMLFITHQIPRGLKFDEVVSLGARATEAPVELRRRAGREELVEA